MRELRGRGFPFLLRLHRNAACDPWETSEMLGAKSDQEVGPGKGGEFFSDSSRFITKMSYSDTS